jgi:hypothetical protein
LRRALLVFLAGCTFLVGGPDPRDTSGGSPDLSTGPCADVQTDPHNCGACGHDCGLLPGVDPNKVGCTVGVCDLRGACLPALADCSGGYADGCETDLTLANHCGSCTAQCGGTTALCARDANGKFFCASGCSATTPTQCGTSCVDTLSNAHHCGDCNTVCAGGVNMVGVCQGGACVTACSAGFHLCSGVCSSSSSIQSCGALCTPCPAPPANGVEICDPFAGCDFKCNAGFTKQPGVCVQTGPVPDMATLPLCDCRGLSAPLGDGNQCPFTNSCVANNCCAEDQFMMPPPAGTCTDPTPCQTSNTPQ